MRKVLRAAKLAVEMRREVTIPELIRISGCGELMVRNAIRKLRDAGLWEWPVDDLGWLSMREKHDGYDASVLTIAPILADEYGCINLPDVARALGLSYMVVKDAVGRLRDRGLWPYHRAWLPEPNHHKDEDMADAIAAHETRRCRDGRNEADDPIEFPGMPPWSGRAIEPARVSYRKQCRRYLREWAEITGRAL
jgi:hypothetical protein